MKVVIVFSALLALSLAAPQGGQTAQILKFESENDGIEKYNFAFETSDPISRSESGQVNNPGKEDAAIAVNGEYSYTGPDGKSVKVTFVSDENGYRPHTQIS